MRGVLSIALLAVLAVSLHALSLQHQKRNYQGYQIVRLTPQHSKHVAFIHQLKTEDKLEILHNFRGLGHHAFMLVPPAKVESLLQTLYTFEMPYKVTVADLSERIKREAEENGFNAQRAYDPTKYNSYEDQVAYIQALQAKNLPQVKEIKVIGQSLEGRDIHAIRLGLNPNPKKTMLFDGGIHAREWIAHSVAFHHLDMFTTSATDYETAVLNDIDVLIIPNLNPDGYIYSQKTDRMWRKNRRPGNGFCSGVDLNRNFPYKYGVAGTSDDICDETYDGTGPASEPETQVFENFVAPLASTIGGYITYHSYSQLILYPWGYAYNAYPDDVQDLINAGNQMVTAIKAVHKVKYTCENSAGLYPAAGASDDYTKSLGVKYVYTVELRPGEDDWDGFELPASQIVPTGEEAYAGAKIIIDLVRKM